MMEGQVRVLLSGVRFLGRIRMYQASCLLLFITPPQSFLCPPIRAISKALRTQWIDDELRTIMSLMRKIRRHRDIEPRR